MRALTPHTFVIADTTPLIVLSESGNAWILKELFGTILVPDAVWRELGTRIDRPHRRALLASDWLQRREVTAVALDVSNLRQLDPGETEALTLALELPDSVILIDERAGRIAAAVLNLRLLGTLGILLLAKQRGLIEAIAPIVDEMRRNSRFRLDDRLLANVLASVGE